MPSIAKPLSGWRVLVPRGGKWGDAVSATLRSYGATPVVAPLINFASSDDDAGLAATLARLEAGEFDWLVVTSAVTVDVLVSQKVSVPASTRIAAVGDTTSSSLTTAGYDVDYVPEHDQSARGMLRAWPADARGRALVAHSDLAEATLIRGLTDLGLEVEDVTAYRTVGVPVGESVASDVASGRIGAVLVTSGSVAKQIALQLAPLPDTTVVACIGPRTAFDTRGEGLAVHVIAENRTADSLVESLAEYVANEQIEPPEL
jgi:uroporphyrinogen-III synthase